MHYSKSSVDFLKFIKAALLIVPGSAAAFPMANELLNAVSFPFDEPILSIFTSIFCSLVLLATFNIGYASKKSLSVGLILLPVSFMFYKQYLSLASPIIALEKIGINPQTAAIFANKDLIFIFYVLIFVSLTASSSILFGKNL